MHGKIPWKNVNYSNCREKPVVGEIEIEIVEMEITIIQIIVSFFDVMVFAHAANIFEELIQMNFVGKISIDCRKKNSII